jgi:hypothetical protein
MAGTISIIYGYFGSIKIAFGIIKGIIKQCGKLNG